VFNLSYSISQTLTGELLPSEIMTETQIHNFWNNWKENWQNSWTSLDVVPIVILSWRHL